MTKACVTVDPMKILSGARKLWTLMVSSGAISVSMSITGMPASIILLTGWVSLPMPKAWMATKSHFWDAMLSMAARCLTASSSPSNQVTSTLNIFPHHSAACLPWAHQVACRPALEKAALSGFADRSTALAASAAMAGSRPAPSSIAAPAVSDAARMKSRRECGPVSWSDMQSSLEPRLFAVARGLSAIVPRVDVKRRAEATGNVVEAGDE